MPASRRSSLPTDPVWVTVLAGGVGSRFWPVSTPSRPKQLLPLAGPRPLVVETVARARALTAPERIRILAGDHLVQPMRRVLPGLSDGAFLVEPEAKGTAPVLAWAAWTIAREEPDATLVSLHADHVVSPEEAFVETVRQAVRVARDEDALVTIGAVPDRVETGYGHIQPGDPLDPDGDPTGFRVADFHEKPDADTARRYMEAGCLWNTGIFVWTARRFLAEVEAHAPELHGALALLETDGPEAFFRAAPAGVVDRAVIERSRRVACVPASFDWEDVGSWGAVARTRETDPDGNVTEGGATVVDGTGNVAWSDDGGRVVLWGVDDLVVVRSGDATVVFPRDRAPRLKELLADLETAE